MLGIVHLAANVATSQFAGIQTVFVIVMENHDWSEIKGNPRTIQEIFGVTPLLGDAQKVVDLADLFLQ